MIQAASSDVPEQGVDSALIVGLACWDAAEAIDSVQVMAGCSGTARSSGNRLATLLGRIVVAGRCDLDVMTDSGVG